MKKYIHSVEVTIRRRVNGSMIESEPWELSDEGLYRAILRAKKELSRLEELRTLAIERGDTQRASSYRRQYWRKMERLYDLEVEEEFRLGH